MFLFINKVAHLLPWKYRWMIANTSMLRHIYDFHRYELWTIWHHIQSGANWFIFFQNVWQNNTFSSPGLQSKVHLILFGLLEYVWKLQVIMSVDRKLAFLTLYLNTGTPSWEAYAARASSLPLLSSGMVNTPTISWPFWTICLYTSAANWDCPKSKYYKIV